MRGIVKTLNDRGFGFVSSIEGGPDLFFHSNSLIGARFDDLMLGDTLTCEIESTPRGARASKVQRDSEPLFGPVTRVINTALANTDDPPSSASLLYVGPFTRALVERLKRHPEDLYQLHPETFEQLVAEIFHSEGYEIEMIGAFNQPDGGVDIIAVRREVGGLTLRCAIQCKRYARHRKVSAEPLRSLRGSMDRNRAQYGVLATTSYFTKPAKEEVSAHLWMIGLRDYDDIVASLDRLHLTVPPCATT